MSRLILIVILTIGLFASKIEILQKINLNDTKFDIPFNEVSGVTYDAKNRLLYMISDNGALYIFKAYFDDKAHLTPLKAYYLHDKNGTILPKIDRDSEDITLDDKGNLYLAFERKEKISQYSKDGAKIKDLPLPKPLLDLQFRTNNKIFESLTYNKKYGLLTALENPPYGIKRSKQSIYSLSGRVWKFKTTKKKRPSITAIETIDDENILILERAFDGFFGHHAISLQKFNLTTNKQELIWQIDNYCFDSIENYEGLAKVDKNHFIMISDDNKLPIFNTILIYFKLEN